MGHGEKMVNSGIGHLLPTDDVGEEKSAVLLALAFPHKIKSHQHLTKLPFGLLVEL
jgi:hypothetical protein